MEYYVFTAVLAVIVFYGEKRSKAGKNQAEMLERFNDLRGIFAVLIIIGHCSIRFEKEVIPLLLIHKFNMVGVCFFLFVSGWGLAYGYLEKGKDLRGFVGRKIGYLMMLSFASSVIYFIFNEMILGRQRSFSGILWFILRNTNWYVWEICFFYIVFYISTRFGLGKTGLGIQWTASLAICVLALIFGWDRAFYFSAFCFPAGIAVNRYWEKIWIVFRQHSRLLIPASVFVGVISVLGVFSPQNSWWGGVILRNVFGIMAMVLLWILMQYVKIVNPVLKYLKSISMELYLYQFTVMSFFKKIYVNTGRQVDLSYVVIVMAVLVCGCSVIRKMDVGMKKIFMEK